MVKSRHPAPIHQVKIQLMLQTVLSCYRK